MGRPGGADTVIPPKTDLPVPKWIRLSPCGEGDVLVDSARHYIDHYDLPISQDLKDRIDRWNDWFEKQDDRDFERRHARGGQWTYQGPESPLKDAAFDAEGAAIALLLTAELPDWTVVGY
jgi:hypothetical protein